MRVAQACATHLASSVEIAAKIIDPLEIDLPREFKPHFSYRTGLAPKPLQALADLIQQADGFVMVSPEYNHSMSPALMDLLNHFGSSSFSYKPSAIVTYSAGQWGGSRAAIGLRPFLSELGCLPVSAMVHIPHAQDVLDEGGHYRDSADPVAWAKYLDRTFAQLLWWAKAAKERRDSTSDDGRPAPFKVSPLERDAP
jgi:NAD(P)H-dependent FMN reductase